MHRPPLRSLIAMIALPLALVACQGSHSGGVPGDRDDHTPFSAIAENEKIRILGTEPFWGGDVIGALLTYSTPELPAGTPVPVKRFAGRGGLSYSGELEGKALTIAVTPGACSDGMSDRTYPFAVTLQIGTETRNGCGWTERQPWAGAE